MGFSKKGKYPDRIEHLDFATLTTNFRRVLESYMGLDRNHVIYKNDMPGRLAALKSKCLQDAMTMARAQEGYETIVLGKVAALQNVIAPDVERRTYEIIADLIKQNEEAWTARGQEGVEEILKAVRSEVKGLAKRALSEASDNFRPLTIVEAGKKPRKE